MKIFGVSFLVFALTALPAISETFETANPGTREAIPGGSFVNGTWDIKDSNGNKTGTAVINKNIGQAGTITVTDTNGNTYTGTVNTSGTTNYSLSPAGSPMGSSGSIVQTATSGTLSFNNFDIPGTDFDGTLNN